MSISMRTNSPLNILSKIVVWAVLLLLQLPVATYADEIEEVVVIGEHCDAACREANNAESMKMIRIENIMKSYRDASSYDLSIAMKGSCLNALKNLPCKNAGIKCNICTGRHQHDLKMAECTNG